MLRRQPKTFAELTTKTWNSEIGFSGYDSVEKTINGKKVSYDKRKNFASDQANPYQEDREHKKRRQYRNSFRRQLADFFLGNFTGMRNDTKANAVGLTILKNWAWWPEAGAPTGLRVLQWIGMGLGILTLITPAWMLYSLARNIVMNSAKAVFKFLPQLAVNGFTELQKRIKDELDHGNRGNFAKVGLQVAHIGLAILKVPFQLLQFAAGAVLSPIDNADLAYKKAGMLGWLASVASSAILYAILLPIVAPLLAKYVPYIIHEYVAPFVAAKLPGLAKAAEAVGNFLAPATGWIANTAYPAVSGWVSSALSWVFTNTIGASSFLMNVTFMFNYSVTSLASTFGLAVEPITIGLGAALATVGTVIGTPLSRLYNFAVNKLIGWKAAPIADPVVAPVLVAPAAPRGTKAEIAADLQTTQNNLLSVRGTLATLQAQLDPADPRTLAGKIDAVAHQADEAARQVQAVRAQAVDKGALATLERRIGFIEETQRGQAAAIAVFGAVPAPSAAPAVSTAPAVEPVTAPKFNAGDHS